MVVSSTCLITDSSEPARSLSISAINVFATLVAFPGSSWPADGTRRLASTWPRRNLQSHAPDARKTSAPVYNSAINSLARSCIAFPWTHRHFCASHWPSQPTGFHVRKFTAVRVRDTSHFSVLHRAFFTTPRSLSSCSHQARTSWQPTAKRFATAEAMSSCHKASSTFTFISIVKQFRCAIFNSSKRKPPVKTLKQQQTNFRHVFNNNSVRGELTWPTYARTSKQSIVSYAIL